MIQGTEEWQAIRLQHIGASDAPIIMGVSPWKNVIELWEEKLFEPEFMKPSFSQKRGIYLEDFARDYFFLSTGIEVFPDVAFSFDYDFMMASFDGISVDGKTLVEIKCPGKKDHEIALKSEIPNKYYPQLQHQLFVAGLDKMSYLSYDGESGIILDVYRDDVYIEVMIEREKSFWNCVKSFIQPNLEEFSPWKRQVGSYQNSLR